MCLSQAKTWISNVIWRGVFLCSVSEGERWLVVLLILEELWTILCLNYLFIIHQHFKKNWLTGLIVVLRLVNDSISFLYIVVTIHSCDKTYLKCSVLIGRLWSPKCEIRFQKRKAMLNSSERQLEHRQVPSKRFHCDFWGPQISAIFKTNLSYIHDKIHKQKFSKHIKHVSLIFEYGRMFWLPILLKFIFFLNKIQSHDPYWPYKS